MWAVLSMAWVPRLSKREEASGTAAIVSASCVWILCDLHSEILLAGFLSDAGLDRQI